MDEAPPAESAAVDVAEPLVVDRPGSKTKPLPPPGTPPPHAFLNQEGVAEQHAGVALGTAKTRAGTAAVVRSVQLFVSLFAVAFAGAVEDGVLKGRLDSYNYFLAAACLAFVASITTLGYAVADLQGLVPRGVTSFKHLQTVLIFFDLLLLLLCQFALMAFPSEVVRQLKDGRASVAALCVVIYTGCLVKSVLMTYKDMVVKQYASDAPAAASSENRGGGATAPISVVDPTVAPADAEQVMNPL